MGDLSKRTVDAALKKPTVSEIALRLGAFTSARKSPAWNELTGMASKDAGFGELRDPVDLSSLPFDKSIRIVYLVDALGPVLRWLVPEANAERILGGIFHDHLERGDGHGEARSGWLRIDADGVNVRP